MAKILIAGYGDVGMCLAKRLTKNGHHVTGLRRNAVPTSDFEMKMITADITAPKTLQKLDNDFDQVFFMVAPDSRDETHYQAVYDEGLGHLLNHFSNQAHKPHWIFISSTRVYGATEGQWVDESTPASPKDAIGACLLSGEKKVLSHAPDNTIVRFSGIYGPARTRLLRLAKEGMTVQSRPPYYTNRIHRDDCAGFLEYLLQARLSGQKLANCYVASDDAPVPQFDVISWLAEQMGVPAPQPQVIEKGGKQNKRCRNDRMKSSGYALQYPSYQEGYRALFESTV